MNRQARLVGCPEWTDYGNVTLYEAGRREAVWQAQLVNFIDRDYVDFEIETRDAEDKAIPASVNTYRVTFNVEVLNGRNGCEDK